MTDLRNWGQEILAIWNQWPQRRRLSLVLGTCVGVGAFMILVFFSRHTALAPLLTNLSAQDAAQITERLASSKVPYELAAGGSAIMVPADQVHELRLRLAGEGLPRGGGVGFELFDEQAFGVSRFAERLNYLRALQGELQRTIAQLDPVRGSRVHIVVPEKRLFRDYQEKARAAVSLQLLPGRRLSASQVQAIVHLVSSSVAGLSPGEVTVVDSGGTILAKGGDPHATSLAASLEHQRSVETALEERVRQILARVVGPDNASVRVTVEMDHTQTERTTESYDPDTVVMRSEQVSEEQRRSGARQKDRGIPGARTNLIGQVDERLGAGRSQTAKKRSEIRNYEINKVVSREVRPVAQLARVSVAVLVNQIATTGEDGTVTYTPRSAAEMARLSALVEKAVGYDPSRGDQVEVQSMPFDIQPESPPVENPLAWLDLVARFWPPVVILLVVLFFALVAWQRTNKAPPRPQLLNPPRTVRELETVLAAQPTPAIAAPEQEASASLSAQKSDPARAAAVLKGWIGEA